MKYNYFVALHRVTGIRAVGGYFYGGRDLYAKYETIEQAKKYVADEFQRGYFNYATIHDRSNDSTIERFIGHDWKILRHDTEEE